MMPVYVASDAEIRELKENIVKLQYQQNELQIRLEANNELYNDISKKLAESYKKLNELNEVKQVFDEFPIKKKEVTKKVTKKMLKWGIPGTILAWFVGGAILNSFIGAFLGVGLSVATVVISGLVSCHRKLKKDKKIIENNNIRTIKREITEEETKIDGYLAQQRQIDKDNRVVSRVYNENQTKLEDFNLRLSILEPVCAPTSTKPKPYIKTNPMQS